MLLAVQVHFQFVVLVVLNEPSGVVLEIVPVVDVHLPTQLL